MSAGTCATCGRPAKQSGLERIEVRTMGPNPQVVEVECAECVHATGNLLAAREARAGHAPDGWVRFDRARVGEICQLEEWDLKRIDEWVEFIGGKLERRRRPVSRALRAGRRVQDARSSDTDTFWVVPLKVFEQEP